MDVGGNYSITIWIIDPRGQGVGSKHIEKTFATLEEAADHVGLLQTAPALLEACKEILRALAFVPGIKQHKEVMEACSSVGTALAAAEGR